MKITIDSKTGIIKRGTKELKDLNPKQMDEVRQILEKALGNSGQLSEWDIDSMWMSYRYCIGRHTIASHSRAGDIAKHCYGKMSDERSIFNAYDMNRCIEDQIRFFKVNFWFPLGPQNRIYTSALDIFCQFVEDYHITTKEELLKYKDVHIELYDNERGYKFETVTWEEWLRPQVLKIMQEFYNNDCMSEDFAWDLFKKWQNGNEKLKANLDYKLMPLVKNMPNIEHFYLTDIDDLMVWNDLVHLFDKEHHHKSILTDGTECEWFWTYTHDCYKDKDYDGREVWRQKEIGYRRIRVPVDKFNGLVTTYIPDESIKEDLY